VITSRVGQAQEIIQHMKNGLLCEPDDIDSFSAGIRLLLERPDLRTHIGRNARKCIESQHTWRHRGEALCSLCRFLVQSSRESI